MTEFNSIKNLHYLVHILKGITRQGWEGRGLPADTIASHTYGAMVLGFTLAKEENVDITKVIKMLLIHDLIMAEIEDVSPTVGKFASPSRYKEKRKMENDAINLVARELPNSIKDEYLSLFEEFQEMKTAEACAAREADKLETLLQGNIYESETGRTDILDEFLVTYKGIFKTKTGKSIYQNVKREHAKRMK